MRTIRQRAVLRRRPRAFAIGTQRQWQGGVFVKVGSRQWRKLVFEPFIAKLPPAAAKDRGGLAGLARAMADADRSEAKLLPQLAYHALAALSGPRDSLLMPLPAALATVMSTTGSNWELYCARRWADFNDGMVDMDQLAGYAHSAARHHEGSLPETFAKAEYSGPRTVADINLASWMEFFHEGGSLNQPAWLETNRFKDLRHQFEMLARNHGGH